MFDHSSLALPRPSLRVARFALLAALVFAAPAAANPTLGFLESFHNPGIAGFTGGSSITNPGTGGVLGAGDGFLLIAKPGPTPGNLGAFNPTANYTGNWTAAGITQVKLWMNDVNTADSLEMHVALGNQASGNFWESNTGIIPPHNSWAQFTIDVSDSATFSFIGTAPGSFTAAIANVDRMLIRYDLAPYDKHPDTVVGDVGVDEILFTGPNTGVEPPATRTTGQVVRLAPPGPNPSRGAVTLRMDVPAGQAIRVQVVDAAGRIVRSAVLPAGPAGARTWQWDGATDRGVAAAPGVYRVRAFGPSGGTSQPLVRVN